MRVGVCADCGTEFTAGRTGPVAARCPECREAGRRRALYERWRAERAERYGAARRDAVCADCGRGYQRHRMDTKSTRCPECRPAAKARSRQAWSESNAAKAQAAKRRWFEANRAYVKQAKHRRRVLARDAEADRFTAADVFDRDGWTCQICGAALDPAVKFPDRRSASIDHIVPVALGGTHTLANVQAACMGCNWSKGARIEREGAA